MSEKRVPVPLSEKDRATIQAGMEERGIKSMSDFLRFAALFVCRMKNEPKG